ncbi:MAG: ABC transporter [Rhodobacteraceae bacterium]|nr:ABC transporter [Paracoccaceae bacterium]MBR29387.1 ABC transporter [Paracoccaceae bacterium]
MSGLLALLDDVAAIAKLAAAQLDDIAAQSAKAGAKAAGVVIDDAAVTPKYVSGLPAARELPIVWKIARASAFNKLVILLPAALALNAFLPAALTPLLMLGGCYLCFEGAEKIHHAIFPHPPESGPQEARTLDAAHLETQRVKGAIKTDFILSAEIMTISLAAIESDHFVTEAVALAAVGLGITVLVYGAVALLVKADDFGLTLTRIGRLEATRALGRGIVKAMPTVMKVIATVGTAAMLWVGGSILTHGLHELGWHAPSEIIGHAAGAVAAGVGEGMAGAARWIVTAGLDGVLGLAAGFALIPLVTRVIVPLVARLRGETAGDGGAH